MTRFKFQALYDEMSPKHGGRMESVSIADLSKLFRLDVDDISLLCIIFLYGLLLIIPLRGHAQAESWITALLYSGTGATYGFALVELFPNKYINSSELSAQLICFTAFAVTAGLRWARFSLKERHSRGLDQNMFT